MLYFGAEKRERGALTKNEKSWNRVKKPDRTHHDLNVGPVDLQSTALPLSYTSSVSRVKQTSKGVFCYIKFWHTTATNCRTSSHINHARA